MRSLSRRLRNTAAGEAGVLLVIIAVGISVLFGFLALTIDVGGALAMRRALVKAADAAALAGAQACAFRENPQTAAASYATANLNDPSGLTIAYSPSSGCGSSNTFTVTLSKSVPQDFTPFVGGSSTKTVIARATAKWGGALSGPPQPFGLNSGAWSTCFGSVPPPAVGTQCSITFDNGPLGGVPVGGTASNQWGGINLNSWGQFTPSDKCPPSPGASTVRTWVPGGYQNGGVPQPLEVHPTTPTYVCADGGLANSVWDSLNDTPPKGTLQYFAIIDTAGLVAPFFDKYRVLGLTALKVVNETKSGSSITVTLEWMGYQLSPGLPGVPSNFGLVSVGLVPNP